MADESVETNWSIRARLAGMVPVGKFMRYCHIRKLAPSHSSMSSGIPQ